MVDDGRNKEDEGRLRARRATRSDGRRRDGCFRRAPRPPGSERNRHSSSIQLWLWQLTVTTHRPHDSSTTRLDIDIICRLGQIACHPRRACFCTFVLVLGMLC